MVEIVLLLLALNPLDHAIHDAVDRIEVNHVYNQDGGLSFDQWIGWDWNIRKSRWDVVAWRMMRDVRRECQMQKRQWEREHPDGPPYVAEWIGGHAEPTRIVNGWVSQWYDEKSHRLRRVTSSTYIETWTHWDREVVERQILSESMRRQLR